MKWEAYYEPWDAIRDRRVLTALCLIYDKVHVWGIDYGDEYPASNEEIIKFEEINYIENRINNAEGKIFLKKFHHDLNRLFKPKGFDVSFQDTTEIDRSLLLSYALDWYPFYNFITPLADCNNPVIVSVDSVIAPSGGLLKFLPISASVGPRTISELKTLLRKDRALGIKRLMREAAKEGEGVCMGMVSHLD